MVGLIALENPSENTFSDRDVDLLSGFTEPAALAIDNARLYEEVRRNEERIEKELRFAQRVQMALLPTELPRPLDDVDVAARIEPARDSCSGGGNVYDPRRRNIMWRTRSRVSRRIAVNTAFLLAKY